MNDMKKILIMGNSGSGKSTLAKRLARERQMGHLDLDTLAWLPEATPTRRPLESACTDIERFILCRTSWVIEGCYGDLIKFVVPFADHLIYLDLPIETCISNAKNRPWEPHKYQSKALQDENLPMLIDWIRDYETRTDEFSRSSHQAIYEDACCDKMIYRANDPDLET